MYAIFEDGGRQFKVEEGQELEIDYRDIPTGQQMTFDKVLAVRGDEGLILGQPILTSASVTAEVVGVVHGEKLYIQKARRRKTFRRRTGHRQIFTRVKIAKING
jgi:large subunit ribosomal protein L21